MTSTLRATLITLGDPGQLTGGYLFHRRLAELAPTLGWQLDFISVPDRPFPLAVLDARRLLKAIDRRQPDVVVLDSIVAWSLAFATPAQPLVGMLHQPPGGIDFGLWRTTAQASLDRRAYRRMRRVLVASDSLADDLRPTGLPVHVVPPGRDVASEVGPPPGDLRRGRRIAVLCVGNWMARKGILSLLEACARLDPCAARLHLVGRTDTEPRYAARVWARLSSADLFGRVEVHGPVSVGEVAALYSAADVFALPSLKEPYGTVYGEAMAFGLPVVGWRAGNLPYLASHEREGLLVSPGDAAGLSEALQRLANDAAFRAQLGEAARQRAQARPTWEQVARMFFDHLRQVISGT